MIKVVDDIAFPKTDKNNVEVFKVVWVNKNGHLASNVYDKLEKAMKMAEKKNVGFVFRQFTAGWV
jgi:hypothetical protein